MKLFSALPHFQEWFTVTFYFKIPFKIYNAGRNKILIKKNINRLEIDLT